MFAYENPYLISFLKPIKPSDPNLKNEITLKDVNKVFIKLLDHKLQSYTIEEAQRYINFTLINVHSTFDANGV